MILAGKEREMERERWRERERERERENEQSGLTRTSSDADLLRINEAPLRQCLGPIDHIIPVDDAPVVVEPEKKRKNRLPLPSTSSHYEPHLI